MKKLDKDRNVTQEYLDYVSNLKREDLETFYIGADLLVDRLNNIINKAIEIYEECCKTQIFSTCDLDMYEVLKGDEENEKRDKKKIK